MYITKKTIAIGLFVAAVAMVASGKAITAVSRHTVESRTAALGALNAFAAGTAAAQRPVFLNYDETHYAHSRMKMGVVPSEGEVRSLVSQYKGTHVTDILFCISGRIAGVPNGVKESWCDKYRQTFENGRAVSYTNHYIRLYREMDEVLKLDRYALWIDEARRSGIRPWLSFRMNDCHDTYNPTSFLHSDFYHNHPEYRRIRHRAASGHFDKCLDYSFAEVRERELKFIREMLMRYDVDGIEIDWQREVYCFAPGRESAAAITAFMRSVRTIADEAAKRRARPVRILSRVPADPETALRFGFDAATWADEKLVDVLVPCSRWETADNDIPTDVWKRLIRKSDVVLASGLELRICNHPWKAPFYMLTDQIRGWAAAQYSLGADALYLYNYFDDPGWKSPKTTYWRSFNQPQETKGVAWENQLKWLNEIGSPSALAALPRDHMLTYRDIVPLWEEVRRPFPAWVRNGKPKFFRLATGRIPGGCTLRLRIGVKGGKAPEEVFVNSRPCVFLKKEPCVPAFTSDPLCVYEVPHYEEDAAVVEILTNTPVELSHLDLQVRP